MTDTCPHGYTMTDHFVDVPKMVYPEPPQLSEEQVYAFLGELRDLRWARAFLKAFNQLEDN